LTITDAICDLISCEEIKDHIHQDKTDYQKESIHGRTPDINGRPIKSNGIINNELPRHLPIISERFSLFNENEDGSALRNRIKDEGINISGKAELVKHLVENTSYGKTEIIDMFKKGDVDKELLDILLTKKNIRIRLDRKKPSATILTIADDYISPFEARTFSVRELARIQSFDDSFQFYGKRTTGGLRRRVEIPQYSQVGNAVPPLLAKAVAGEIMKVLG
jgi:DNA (cytosine-5)-methyltransferase 1